MRLYVSKHGFKGKNLTNLKLIVEFIVGVYYPLWFEAKVKHSFIEGQASKQDNQRSGGPTYPKISLVQPQ